MYQTYGLFHNLLWNGIPFKWSIAQEKSLWWCRLYSHNTRYCNISIHF